MNKQEQVEFDEMKQTAEKAQADIQTLIDECNARGEIINNQAQQLREKDAKILDLYNQLCPALKKHLDDFNELVELRGKVTAYEAELAVYKAQIEKLTNIASGGTNEVQE